MELHRAAGANRVAVSRALKKLRETDAYRQSNPEEQAISEQLVKKELWAKR